MQLKWWDSISINIAFTKENTDDWFQILIRNTTDTIKTLVHLLICLLDLCITLSDQQTITLLP